MALVFSKAYRDVMPVVHDDGNPDTTFMATLLVNSSGSEVTSFGVSGNVTTVGPDAQGAAATGNPVLFAGKDYSNLVHTPSVVSYDDDLDDDTAPLRGLPMTCVSGGGKVRLVRSNNFGDLIADVSELSQGLKGHSETVTVRFDALTDGTPDASNAWQRDAATPADTTAVILGDFVDAWAPLITSLSIGDYLIFADYTGAVAGNKDVFERYRVLGRAVDLGAGVGAWRIPVVLEAVGSTAISDDDVTSCAFVSTPVSKNYQLSRSAEGVDSDWAAVYEFDDSGVGTPNGNAFQANSTDPSLIADLIFGFEPNDGSTIGRFLANVRPNSIIILQDQNNYGVNWGRYKVDSVTNLTATSWRVSVTKKNSGGTFADGSLFWALFRKAQTGASVILGASTEQPLDTVVAHAFQEAQTGQVLSGLIDEEDGYVWEYEDLGAANSGKFYITTGIDIVDTVSDIRVNVADLSGANESIVLQTLALGDEIAIANILNVKDVARFIVVGEPQDLTTHWQVGVLLVSQTIETPADGDQFRFVFTKADAFTFPDVPRSNSDSQVTVTGASGQLLAEQPRASLVAFQNHGSANVYIARDTSASVSTTPIRLKPDGTLIEQPNALGHMYQGPWAAISDGADCKVGIRLEIL